MEKICFRKFKNFCGSSLVACEIRNYCNSSIEMIRNAELALRITVDEVLFVKGKRFIVPCLD